MKKEGGGTSRRYGWRVYLLVMTSNCEDKVASGSFNGGESKGGDAPCQSLRTTWPKWHSVPRRQRRKLLDEVVSIVFLAEEEARRTLDDDRTDQVDRDLPPGLTKVELCEGVRLANEQREEGWKAWTNPGRGYPRGTASAEEFRISDLLRSQRNGRKANSRRT